MVKVEFKLNGRTVRPDQIANQLEKALFKEVESNIRKKLWNVRDPETGASPTVPGSRTVSQKSLFQGIRLRETDRRSQESASVGSTHL